MDFDAIYQQAMSGPDEEQKRMALAQALAAAGFGILGAPAGRGWQGAVRALGQGGLLGMNVYNSEMANAANAPMTQLDKASKLMDMRAKMQGYEDDEAARDVLRNLQPARQQLPSMSPTNENAERLTVAQASVGPYEQLNSIADAMDARGLPKRAMEYRAAAEKYAPKYKGMETVMKDGKPVLVQTYENRAPTPMHGYTPKPDYRQVDTGGRVGFYDPLTGQAGGGFDKTMTPGEVASNAVARGNLGINQRQADLAEQRFAYDKQKDADDRANTGKAAAKPTDQQLAARGFLSRMEASSQILNKLEQDGYTPGTGSAVVDAAGNLPIVGGVAKGVFSAVGSAASPNMQPYRQAQMDWVRAKLRKESGAVIGDNEMADEIRTYFPQPGDGARVIAQKREARKRAERQVAIMGGIDAGSDPLGMR